MKCIICKLLSGELEVSLIHRDNLCAAFMDIQPINPGHLLVVPCRHARSLADLKEDEGARMFLVAQRLASALRKTDIKCEGVNFFLADGAAAGQEVFHSHLHVFPRYPGDGFGLVFSPKYSQKSARKELDQIAVKIKTALEAE